MRGTPSAAISVAGPWATSRGTPGGSEESVAIYALGELVPTVAPDAFVHEMATVIGDVRIGAGSSVWPSAVLRGDFGAIVIGTRTSVQDGVVIHTTPGRPTIVGDRCVIGHLAHLEGCTVGDQSLIGVGAAVLARAEIGAGAAVGAGAVVTHGTVVPPGLTALGVPARVREDLPAPAWLSGSHDEYVAMAVRFRRELRRIG